MSGAKRAPPTWVALGVLVALVATNAMLLILLGARGPLIGIVFYGVLLALMWRRQLRNHRTVMVGGLVGLAVHLVEVVALGWSAFPGLMALNLILPATLALVAWLAEQRTQQAGGSR